VLGGPGAYVPRRFVLLSADGLSAIFDGVRADYTIEIAPGETQRLMLFGELSYTASDALTNAALFDDPANLEASGLLSGLSVRPESS